MGIYYRMISRRTRKIQGVEVAFSNFYGKAPGFFANGKPHKAWNTFCTKAANNADAMQARGIEYVMMAQDIGEMSELGEVAVAKYNGQARLHDGFWDDNIVGKAVKVKGRWQLEFYPVVEDESEEEWTPETADYCDPGSIHHY